jgi:hypothetical protein
MVLGADGFEVYESGDWFSISGGVVNVDCNAGDVSDDEVGRVGVVNHLLAEFPQAILELLWKASG